MDNKESELRHCPIKPSDAQKSVPSKRKGPHVKYTSFSKRAYPNFGDHCEKQSPKAEKQLTENSRTNSPKRPRNSSPAVSFLFTRVLLLFRPLRNTPFGLPPVLAAKKRKCFGRWTGGSPARSKSFRNLTLKKRPKTVKDASSANLRTSKAVLWKD